MTVAHSEAAPLPDSSPLRRFAWDDAFPSRHELHESLRQDETHLWQANLDAEFETFKALKATLCADERASIARLHLPHERRRRTLSLGLLRHILALYLPVTPCELPLQRGAHGKPHLGARAGVRFNVSHSREQWLLAVSWQREVGVDIEHLRFDWDDETLQAIAGQILSEPELTWWRTLEASTRRAALFQLWTSHEAILKADGRGFQLSPQGFCVVREENRVEKWDADRRCWRKCPRWWLSKLPVEGDCAASLVIERQPSFT